MGELLLPVPAEVVLAERLRGRVDDAEVVDDRALLGLERRAEQPHAPVCAELDPLGAGRDGEPIELRLLAIVRGRERADRLCIGDDLERAAVRLREVMHVDRVDRARRDEPDRAAARLRAPAEPEQAIPGHRGGHPVHRPLARRRARDRAMLAVRMRDHGPDEAGTAITERGLQLGPERVRDVIVGGERVTEVRDAERMIERAGTRRGEGRGERVECVVLAGRVDARVLERRGCGRRGAGARTARADRHRKTCTPDHEPTHCSHRTASTAVQWSQRPELRGPYSGPARAFQDHKLDAPVECPRLLRV